MKITTLWMTTILVGGFLNAFPAFADMNANGNMVASSSVQPDTTDQQRRWHPQRY